MNSLGEEGPQKPGNQGEDMPEAPTVLRMTFPLGDHCNGESRTFLSYSPETEMVVIRKVITAHWILIMSNELASAYSL